MGKREDTRALIIEKTAPLFNKCGYAGTSMSDITRATGLTKGSIYGNFRDKDDVALQAFAFSLRMRKKGILSALRKAGDSPLARLRAYPQYFQQSHGTIMAYGGCPLVNASMDAADTNPGLHAAVRTAIESWRVAVQRLFKEGVALGELRADLDVERQASLFISMIEGGLWMTRATNHKKDLLFAMQNVEAMLAAIAR